MKRIFRPLKAKRLLPVLAFLLLAGLVAGCAANEQGLAGGSAGTQGAYQLPPLVPVTSDKPTP